MDRETTKRRLDCEKRFTKLESNYDAIKASVAGIDKNLSNHITEIQGKLDRIDEKLDAIGNAITEFNIVKRVVYGLVGLALTAVATAVIYQVIK